MDYADFKKTQKRYDRDSIPARWENFNIFNMNQITEIMTRCNPGLISIEIPAEAMDEEMTVVAVQLEGKVTLKF